MSIKSFVDMIDPKDAKKLTVILDSKLYPNDYGISVRPLRVKYNSTVLNMKQLIEIFDKVPYLSVKESRYRTLYRDPMIMTIDLTPKLFEDHIYYDYYIDKLILRSELKKYIAIEKQAYDEIKKFKESHVNEEYVDSYRSNDNDENQF